MKPTEIDESRQFYGGSDGRARDRHSVRVYDIAGRRYDLDLTHDPAAPYFTLWSMPVHGGSGRIVRVNYKQRWGHGLSWEDAQPLAFDAILRDASVAARKAQS